MTMSSTIEQEPSTVAPRLVWPRKVDLFGVGVSVTDYDEAVEVILQAAQSGRSAIVSCQAVHGIIESSDDPVLRAKVNTFDLLTPDGQPVRWAMNLLHRVGLAERVYGPELTWRLCAAAAKAGVSIYLYGATDEVLELLRQRFVSAFPGIEVAGMYSPPFRPLTPEEDREVVAAINRSGAGLVFLGIGCPKQDHFAFDHAGKIQAVQLCVGAAFDFHAGVKSTAPAWMQKRGLEWLYRLWQEPRRLWRRYLKTNSRFVWKLLCAYFRRARHANRGDQQA